MSGLRVALAQGCVLAALLFLPALWLLTWGAPRLGLADPLTSRGADAARFVLWVWAIPSAITLLLLGYLLAPRRALLGSRLAPLAWLGGAALLWGLGLVALLALVVALLLAMAGLPVLPGGVGTTSTIPTLPVLLAYAPLGLVGALFLLAARAWFYSHRPPALLE